MIEETLTERYEQVLEESRRLGQLDDSPEEQRERRQHPRVQVDRGKLPADIDPWVFAIDISISGMAFYSDEPVFAGDVVDVQLRDEEPTHVVVLKCEAEHPDQPGAPARYRLACKFKNEDEGMALLVRIKEMEGLGVA